MSTVQRPRNAGLSLEGLLSVLAQALIEGNELLDVVTNARVLLLTASVTPLLG